MLWNRSGEGISVSICEWYYCILGFALICFDLKDCHLHHVRAPVTKDLIRVELHSKKLLSFQCRFVFFSGQKQPASVFTGRGRNALNLENMYGALVVILSKGGSFWEKKKSSHIHYWSFQNGICACVSVQTVSLMSLNLNMVIVLEQVLSGIFHMPENNSELAVSSVLLEPGLVMFMQACL